MDSSDLTSTIAGGDTLELSKFQSFDAFYTPLEERFERITRMSRALLDVPVAALTVLDGERQWFKSVSGWDVTELPIEKSLCQHTVRENRLTIVADLLRDKRYQDHPLVVGKPGFRFYAGVPLTERSGRVIATLCVFDARPRMLTGEQVQLLQDAGAIAGQELLVEDLNTTQAQLIARLGAARRESLFDPLTRVWNRRGAMPFIEAALEQARAQEQALSVCAVDIDRFEPINDSHGNAAGDKLLAKMAALLIGCVRTEDIVCRYDGDEFLLILPGTGAQAVQEIAERMRAKVAEHPIRTRDGAIAVTVSIGCASRSGFGDESGEALIGRARDALGASKAAGRNQVQYRR